MNNLQDTDISAIEQMLNPQAEFHASPQLKRRTIKAAKAEAEPRRTVRLLPWAAAAACAVAVVCAVCLLYPHFQPQPPAAPQPVVAKHEKAERKADVTKNTKERVKETAQPTPSRPTIQKTASTAPRTITAKRQATAAKRNAPKPEQPQSDNLIPSQPTADTHNIAMNTPPVRHPMIIRSSTAQHLYTQMPAELERQVQALNLEYELQRLEEEYEQSKVKYLEL